MRNSITSPPVCGQRWSVLKECGEKCLQIEQKKLPELLPSSEGTKSYPPNQTQSCVRKQEIQGLPGYSLPSWASALEPVRGVFGEVPEDEDGIRMFFSSLSGF